MSEDADEIINAQLEQGQNAPRKYTDLARCPNPKHQDIWHGLPKHGCPGSHLDNYDDVVMDEKQPADNPYKHGYWGFPVG